MAGFQVAAEVEEMTDQVRFSRLHNMTLFARLGQSWYFYYR